MKNKSARRRVSKEDVRNNARESGGGKRYFKLPKGVDIWTPDKAGSVELDLLPYEVKTDTHPDRRGDKVASGDLWWKFPFKVHRNVGPNQEEVVCPATFGNPCPMCEEKARLAQDYDKNVEAINEIKAKKQVAYIIKRPGDAERISVFTMGAFAFGDQLDEELKDADDSNLSFYDVTKEGRTLKVRFSEEEFKRRKYLKATRFDFIPRKEMDEDEVLGSVPCLDNILTVMEYDDLKKLYLQIDDDDAAPAKAKSESNGKSKSKPAATREGDDDDDDDKGDNDDAPKFKDGDTVTWKMNGNKLTGTVTDVDDDIVQVQVEGGKEYDVPADELKLVEKKEEGKSNGGKESTGKPSGESSGKAKAQGSSASEKNGKSGKQQHAKSDPTFKLGTRVKDDDGKKGTITEISGDDVTFTLVGGKKITTDVADLEIVDEDEEAGDDSESDDDKGDEWKATVGQQASFDGDDGVVTAKILKIDDNDDVTLKDANGKKYTVDVDELRAPESGDDDDEDKSDDDEEEDGKIAVGDKVTWDDGDEEGEAIKLHPSGEKIKVKNSDGESWQPIGDVKKAKKK